MAEEDAWKFNSIVCLDLETTGLPQHGQVKITEVAMIGIIRSHIKQSLLEGPKLPRVIHKLSFTVYPQKLISFDASLITGLYNDLLENVQPWNEQTDQMLIAFLSQLPQPVCLVAHNGMKFDFPILKKHLHQLQNSLPNHILCVDSLPAFQTILPELKAESCIVVEKMKLEMGLENEVLIKAAEKYEKSCHQNHQETTWSIQKQDEKTPDAKHLPPNSSFIYRPNKGVPKSTLYLTNPQVRRSLFSTKPNVSYKLIEVHHQLFNYHPDDSHTAEDDATTLLRCILKTAPKFLKWANENCHPFDSIREL